MRHAHTAAVIVIGDEILSGKFAEENAAYLIPSLRELGVILRRVEVIPDDVDDIADTVRRCAARFDHVFTSGGVGPTHDDLTMEGIARAFGVALRRHPDVERCLRDFYGPRLEERNLRMADLPEGACLVTADHPAWPVARVRNVYVLPGIPAIFRRKFEAIREAFRVAPFTVRRVYCSADEGRLAGHLDAVVAAHPGVAIGSYPRLGEESFRVLVTLESKDGALAERARDDLVARLPVGVVVRIE